MFTFKEIKEAKLSESERARLEDFSRSSEWDALKKYVEGSVLQEAYNYLAGAQVDLNELKGFSRYWLKVVRFIEKVNLIRHEPKKPE